MINTSKEVLIDIKKYKIYWIIMLILFLIFTIVVVRSIKKANRTEIEKIEESIKKAELREINATIKADSAKIELSKTNIKILELEKQADNQSKILNRIENNYSKSLKELINLKDEKIFIPNNVSTSEQFQFISNYKYSEY